MVLSKQALAIDQNIFFIRLAMTLKGTIFMVLAGWLLTAPHLGAWEAALAVTGAVYAGRFTHLRAALLFATSTFTIFLGTFVGDIDTVDHIQALMTHHSITTLNPEIVALGCLVLLMLLMAFLLSLVAKHPYILIAKKPLWCLLMVEALLCGLGEMPSIGAQQSMLIWSFVFTLTPYIWFLTYAIIDQRHHANTNRILQLGVIRPFWSPTYLPHGKGAAFLEKYSAQSKEALAITQLKAIKLLLWANLIFASHEALNFIFIERLHIPLLQEAVAQFIHSTPYSWADSWWALIISHVKFCLQVAFWAHLFIGIARLVGYRLPRGTWRPLESKTLADYFNRFHFYFKEMLIDFFFMPTFLKYFRKHPQLRQFFATFMAAGVGNAVWHFCRDINLVATQGWWQSLSSFSSYAFYCILLAVGVGISQWRASKRIKSPFSLLQRVNALIFIWSFVTCLHLFGDGTRTHTLWERLQFLAFLLKIY